MSNQKVRVRFAPSPTGPLHIGGVRTALFNYLFARKHGGDFILRIEDTDQTRYVEGAENYIIESLRWCGLDFDESVENGGEYGPYRQSERKDIYKQYAQQLIDSGNAYYAFDTPQELDEMRNRLQEAKADNQQYGAVTRTSMSNSLTLSEDEVRQRINTNESYVIRFKMPENVELEVMDIIRGKVIFNTSTLDDKVLFKSDGMPTYHLANVVDDHLMKISHVIRGEEWLPSMPLHVMLYKAFGWDDTMPEFAHLPLLLKPVGKGKLSKRDGDKMGFPVFPLRWVSKEGEVFAGYREDGYFDDAFVNLLALMGWNSGTDQELFTLSELVDKFSLERVGKSGAKFDPEKAKWFNHQYLLKKDNSEIATLFKEELKNKGIEADIEYITKVCLLTKDRANFVKEIWEHASFFFVAPEEYDPKIVKKRWKENTPQIITDIIGKIATTNSFDATTLAPLVKNHIADNELNMGQVMNCLRMSLVGGAKGPDLFEIFEMLGREETIKRLKTAIEIITNNGE